MLTSIFDAFEPKEVALRMPKFSFESKFSLKETLPAMGMTDAFDPMLADLSGITGHADTFIADVIHQSFIGVDEKGTEAAAATAVLVFDTGIPDAVDFHMERPFIILIRDKATDAVLFVGRVVDPSA